MQNNTIIFIFIVMATIYIKELLERCKKGDKEALGLLYTTFSRRMMRVICLVSLSFSAVSINFRMRKNWNTGWGR